MKSLSSLGCNAGLLFPPTDPAATLTSLPCAQPVLVNDVIATPDLLLAANSHSQPGVSFNNR